MKKHLKKDIEEIIKVPKTNLLLKQNLKKLLILKIEPSFAIIKKI